MSWKVGDKAFDLLNGVVTLEKIDEDHGRSENHIWDKDYSLMTTKDGYWYEKDKYPRIVTFEKAKKMGFEIPKRVRKFEAENIEIFTSKLYGGHVLVLRNDKSGFDFGPTCFLGKTGKFTFEWEE